MMLPLFLSTIVVTVNCMRPDGWKLERHTEFPVPGVQEEVVALSSEKEACPPVFEVSYALPQGDIQHTWCPGGRTGLGVRMTTSLANWMPVYASVNGNSMNRMTVACTEAFREVAYTAGIHEPTCEYRGEFKFFTGKESPIRTYEVRIRFDLRDVFWGEAVADASDWISRATGYESAVSPAAAFDPLYSSWYNFHQTVTAAALERDLLIAATDGMKTVILDDGWQTETPGVGYSNCGDWTVASRFSGDLRRHIGNVHRFGQKYMIWSAVPFMGENAVSWSRFKGKFIRVKWGNVWVLDPRFREVREYLADLYARRMREWDADGFKFDFLEQFSFDSAGDPAERENYAGRDIRSLPEAVDALMGDIFRRLREIKPDTLIEYRQPYIGPAIRRFGNMIRVGDCPGDPAANRRGIANLRLTSGRTAVHADMLEWHPEMMAVSAARSILNSIFGVVQYSMILEKLPADHHRMVRHWVRFSDEHRDALLHGAFRPYHPESGYPVIEGIGSDERVIAVYSASAVAHVASDRRAVVINATDKDGVMLDLSARPTAIRCYDTFGQEVAAPSSGTGLVRVACPSQGYLVLSFDQLRLDRDGFELHNLEGTEESDDPDFPGLHLRRFPKAISDVTGSRTAVLSEIRFCSESPSVKIHLGFKARDRRETHIRVFCGDFEWELPKDFALQNGRITCLELDRLKHSQLHNMVVEKRGFSTDVWRIVFDEYGELYLCGIDAGSRGTRKPRADEKPAVRFLTIGGSISQFGLDSWPGVVARRLGWDVWNFAMAGANVWQHEYADYVGSVESRFDAIAFFYGMNCLSMPDDTYRERFRYMLHRLTDRDPRRPVFAVAAFPCNLDQLTDEARAKDPCYPPYTRHAKIFREVVDEFVSRGINLIFVDGGKMMDDSFARRTDGLHLGVYGQILLGIRMSDFIGSSYRAQTKENKKEQL